MSDWGGPNKPRSSGGRRATPSRQQTSNYGVIAGFAGVAVAAGALFVSLNEGATKSGHEIGSLTERVAALERTSFDLTSTARDVSEALLANPTAIEILKGGIGSDGIPVGAVLAFDRPEGCPNGWSQYSDAAGRFIIGVGALAGLTAKTYRETGGVERVQLTVGEMPIHRHATEATVFDRYVEKFQSNGTSEDKSRGEAVIIPDNSWTEFVTMGHRVGSPNGTYQTRFAGKSEERQVDVSADEAGGNQPHNNMPPYIALYFCKKEG